jgi:type VI secretion system protein ImpF
MADLAPKDRLQPSLLDRLTDDEADIAQESRDKRVLSMRGLRRAVLRDLGWIFNATGLGMVQDLTPYPLVMQSVINFGFPDLSGLTASGLKLNEVELMLCEAIWHFEPRILRETLQVTALANQEDNSSPNQVSFEVNGELWGQPLPERLYLKSELDLEIGEIKIFDVDARAA